MASQIPTPPFEDSDGDLLSHLNQPLPTDKDLEKEAEMRYPYTDYEVDAWSNEHIVNLERVAFIQGRQVTMSRVRELEAHLKSIYEMYGDEWTDYAKEWTEKILGTHKLNSK